jgi:hypothetical protein
LFHLLTSHEVGSQRFTFCFREWFSFKVNGLLNNDMLTKYPHFPGPPAKPQKRHLYIRQSTLGRTSGKSFSLLLKAIFDLPMLKIAA